MDAAKSRDSLPERLGGGGHPRGKTASLPSSCFSDIIVERCPTTSSVLSRPSSPYGSSHVGSTRGFAAGTHATGRLFVSAADEESSSDFLAAAGSAAHGTEQHAFSPASSVPSLKAASTRVTSSETCLPATEQSAAVSVPSSLQARDIIRRVKDATMGSGSMCSSPSDSQPLPPKPGPTAARLMRRTTTTNTSDCTGEADYWRQMDGAAARPAARVIRVHRPSHQQHQQQQWGEQTSRRSAQRRLSAVAERENDPELQQIARQELEASDDDSVFTMGEIIERSADHLQQQQYSCRSPEPYDSQQKVQQQQQARPQLQQLLIQSSPACAFGGPVSQTAQQGSARRVDDAAVAAPGDVTAAAAAATGDSGEDISERRTAIQLSQFQENVFRERHAAVEAPFGFPQPVHRSVLQQLLRVRKGEPLSQGQQRCTSGEQQQQQQIRGEDREAQELQQQSRSSGWLRSGVWAEGREAVKGTQTTASMVDSDLERHAERVRIRRPTTAGDDRSRIEAEAAELLRAMQPHEIAAARQELLDRFGPRRFAALQRRALKRATAQQRGQLTQTHDNAGHQRAAVAAEIANKRSVSQEMSRGRPVVERQHTVDPSCLSMSPFSSHCTPPAQSHAESSVSTRDLSDISSASATPTAFVSFAVGRGTPNIVSKQDSQACRPTAAAAEKPVSGDDWAAGQPATSLPAAAAASFPSPAAAASFPSPAAAAGVLPGGGASVVRLDINEAAKLRWTDPLGPEDWQPGPVGFAADHVGRQQLPGSKELQLSQQQEHKQPRGGAPCGNAAAAREVTAMLSTAGRVVAFSPGDAFSPPAAAASPPHVYVKLERLRFDFDGCLRSDLFHVQEAVAAAVVGARAAAMRRRRSLRRLKNGSQQLTEQGLVDVFMEKNTTEGTGIFFSQDGMEEGARNKLERVTSLDTCRRRRYHVARNNHRVVKNNRGAGVDTEAESTENIAAKTLQDAVSEDFLQETSDGSDRLEFYRGLHHHGDAAALPGYTLPELLHLTQSSNQAQAALALQTLAAAIRSGKTLFTCPSLEASAAFAASLHRWADQQQQAAAPATQEEQQQETQHCHTPSSEHTLQQNKQKQSNQEDTQSSLPQHHPPHRRTGMPWQQQRAGEDDASPSEPAAVAAVAGAAVDSVNEPPLIVERNHAVLSDIRVQAKAGYGVGLRRWYSYITRDLYLAWRLHAMLHAQAVAVHRATLSCFAALLGPPVVSGMRRGRAADFVVSTRCRGRSSAFNSKCSNSSSSNNSSSICCRSSSAMSSSKQTLCMGGNRRLDGRSSSRSDSGSSLRRNATTRCDSEGAVDRGHRGVHLSEQKKPQGVCKGEKLSDEEEAEQTSASPERNVFDASAHQGDAQWGPGWASFPVHMKRLPPQLTRQWLQYHHSYQRYQPQKPGEVHSSQKNALRQQQQQQQQKQTTMSSRPDKRMAEPLGQQKQKRPVHREEVDYICTWSLAGLDFVNEGLLVLDCCTGIRRIDLSRNSDLFCAEAAGDDTGARGCRGIFAFWHAFFGRMSVDAAAAQQKTASSLLSVEDFELSLRDKHKTGEKRKQRNAEKGLISSTIEKLNTEEGVSACHSDVDALEARHVSVRNSTRGTPGSDSFTPSTAVEDDILKERSSFTTTRRVPGEDALSESNKHPDVSQERRNTAFLHDSVGALFSSSPVEALVECGNLLPRLTLLLSIYRADEDVERNAIQSLIGLAAGGTTAITYMLSHMPLQERIRSLAEALVIGSAARSERMQRQRRHENLAAAALRAAAVSDAKAAARVYVAARAELDRRTDSSSKKSEWRHQNSVMITGSDNSRGKNSSSSSLSNSNGLSSSGFSSSGLSSSGLSSSGLSSSSGISGSHNDDNCFDAWGQQGKRVELASDKENTEVFVLRRNEYLLLRELLVLLRLWAGWDASKIQKSSADNSDEAAATAAASVAWNDTLVGHESACCALLMQTFTSGIFLLEAKAATKEAHPCSTRSGDVTMWSETAAGAKTAAAAASETICEDQPTQHTIEGSHEEEKGDMKSAPEEEDVLVAAVEAARVLRMLEAKGALRNMFASFYPSAVHALHAFTRRLEKIQEELVCISLQDKNSSSSRFQGLTHPAARNQDKQHKQGDTSCELELELKQQMQQLQQHDLHIQKHSSCEQDDASQSSDLIRELQAAGLDIMLYCPSSAATEETITHGSDTQTKDENEATRINRSRSSRSRSGSRRRSRSGGRSGSSSLGNIRHALQREVAVTWIFQAALIRELLRWGGVAATKEELSHDANIQAYDFLVQVMPLLRVTPSLLTCWKQLELHAVVGDASFLNAAAVQVLQAAMQLLLKASGKLARAVCSCASYMSPPVNRDSTDDISPSGNVVADLHYPTSCNGSSNSCAGDEETSKSGSTTADTPSFSSSRCCCRASRGHTSAVQQAAMKCWTSLVEPVVEALIGGSHAEKERISAECNQKGPVTTATLSSANSMCWSQSVATAAPGEAAAASGAAAAPGEAAAGVAAVHKVAAEAVPGGVAGVGCCAVQQEVVAEHQPAGHDYCFAYQKERLKVCGGALFHVMKKVEEACSHNGGSSIAKTLRLYAVEMGWTSLTSCCCSQCLPPCVSETNMRNSSFEETISSEKTIRTMPCSSRWRGLIPATSESFAGTGVQNRFAALSTIYNSCSMPTPRHYGCQHDEVHHHASATVKDRSDVLYRGKSGHRPAASCSITTEADEGLFEGGNNSYYKYNAVMKETLGLRVSSWLPQDVELFLSNVSFLSTACNWVATSLHLLHHWRASCCGKTCDTAAGLARETECCTSSSSDRELTENERNNTRRHCTVQGPSSRCTAMKQPLVEIDGSNRTESLPPRRRPVVCASEITDCQHCNIFSFNRLEKLAVAAARLASALRSTLQDLFYELRWPRQSPLSSQIPSRTTAEISGSTMLKTEAYWKKQQQEDQQQQQSSATRREYEPENYVQHQATVTSAPLVLFEPLAQLMLSLQLLLRACDRSYKTWNAADEQSCLLAACSAAATPRTFLRALLLLYSSVMESSLREAKSHPSSQRNGQVENESHSRLEAGALWLKGAAQWYAMCCSACPGEAALDATGVYEVLVRAAAAAAAQSGVRLKQPNQQTDASDVVPWPWVLCAADSLDVLLNDAEIQQRKCLFKKEEKNELACTGAAHRTHETIFSQQLAVCPIDAIVGGGIWQCFCCDAALTSDHDVSTGANSHVQTKHIREALSLCHLVLSTPNLARELSGYIPPGVVFAALVSLYTEPHLAGGMGSNRGTGSVVRPQEAAAAGVGMGWGSASSIYARPGVYDTFCKLLDKLLLQPLGERLRDNALRPQPENQQQSDSQEDEVVWDAQRHQEKQMHRKAGERRLPCEKGEKHQRKRENDQQQEERCQEKEKHQQLDLVRVAVPLFSLTQPPSEAFNFSSAFLAVFSGACQTESAALLGALPSTSPSARRPASALLPQHCLHWFPVCCNKAHDVLVEQTARLLLVAQNATEAADPLLSLLLWLLSSPAFPVECRRMLLRGEQTWLKVASQLFCFVYSADMFSSQLAQQKPNRARVRQSQQLQQKAPQANRPLRYQERREHPQHLTQLPCRLHEEPSEEVNQHQHLEELQKLSAGVCVSQVALSAGDTSEFSSAATSLEQSAYWGLQSPRGDVFWFTAPDSLYLVLPGMWREENEEILIGWSSYVQDRLPKGFLLKDWHPTCESEQQTTGCAPQSRQATSRAASCIAALFPLHALALLVADDTNDLVTLLPPTALTRNVTEATREQKHQQEGHTTGGQQQVLLDERRSTREEKQPQYMPDRRGPTVSSGAQLCRSVPPSSQLGQQQVLLRSSPELRCIPRKEAGDLPQSLPVRRVEEDIGSEFCKLRRMLKGRTAPECFTELEVPVAEVADHIARIVYSICMSGTAAQVERSP